MNLADPGDGDGDNNEVGVEVTELAELAELADAEVDVEDPEDFEDTEDIVEAGVDDLNGVVVDGSGTFTNDDKRSTFWPAEGVDVDVREEDRDALKEPLV